MHTHLRFFLENLGSMAQRTKERVHRDLKFVKNEINVFLYKNMLLIVGPL